MKKIISRKFKLSLIAAAVAVALPCAANAIAVTGDVKIDGQDYNPGEFSPSGVGNLINDSSFTMGADGQTLEASNGKHHGVGVQGTSVTVLGKTISITSTKAPDSSAYAALAAWKGSLATGGTLVVGNENTESISLKAKDTGIIAMETGSSVTVTAKELTVVSDGQFGIHAQNNNDEGARPDNGASVVINAGKTSVKSELIGISAFSHGHVEVNGDLEVNATQAIQARGNALIDINKSGEGKVVLNGDIVFSTPGTSSGKIINAVVNVNLAGEGSSWTGNVLKGYPAEYEGKEETEITDGLALTLSDGAQWNVTATEESGAEASQTVKQHAVGSLTMEDGVIKLDDTSATAKVNTISGSGTIEAKAEADSSNESGYKTGSVQIAGTEGDVQLDVNYTDIKEGTISKDDKAKLAALARQVINSGDTTGNGTISSKQTIVEGVVGGSLVYDVTYNLDQEADSDKDAVIGDVAVVEDIPGDVEIGDVTEQKNTGTDALQKISAMNFLTFRSQMNDVSKRMGDLRTMPQSDGAWARVIAGQSEYKSIHNTYQTLQIGADKRIGNFYVGGTASYTDGDGKLNNGKTDDKNYSFGIYGGWMNDDGQYIDIIVKRHKFESDYDIRYLGGQTGKGSMDTWGTSASVEYGWRLGIEGTAYYVEPQAEIMIGHMNGVGYTNRTTDGNVHVKQDGIDTLVGRLGVAAGWVSPEKKGSAYVKASVLHDWEGDAETRVSKDGVSRKVKEEMGGTWGEFAVGGTWNFDKNWAAYGEIETTAGNPVRTTYQFSGGVRYSF